jgi:hypothetical protein
MPLLIPSHIVLHHTHPLTAASFVKFLGTVAFPDESTTHFSMFIYPLLAHPRLGRSPSPSRLSARVRHCLGNQLPLQLCCSKRSLLPSFTPPMAPSCFPLSLALGFCFSCARCFFFPQPFTTTVMLSLLAVLCTLLQLAGRSSLMRPPCSSLLGSMAGGSPGCVPLRRSSFLRSPGSPRAQALCFLPPPSARSHLPVLA